MMSGLVEAWRRGKDANPTEEKPMKSITQSSAVISCALLLAASSAWAQATAPTDTSAGNARRDSIIEPILASPSLDADTADALSIVSALGFWDPRMSRHVMGLLRGDSTGDQASDPPDGSIIRSAGAPTGQAAAIAAVMHLLALQHERPEAAELAQAWLVATKDEPPTRRDNAEADAGSGQQAPSVRSEVMVNYLACFEGLLLLNDLPPVPPMTVTELDRWTVAVRNTHIDQASRDPQSARQTLMDADPIDLVPAYQNALLGCDLNRSDDVHRIFELVRDWQERVAFVPRFSFPDVREDPDLEADPRMLTLRKKILQAWRTWWLGRSTDTERLVEYRTLVAQRLEEQ